MFLRSSIYPFSWASNKQLTKPATTMKRRIQVIFFATCEGKNKKIKRRSSVFCVKIKFCFLLLSFFALKKEKGHNSFITDCGYYFYGCWCFFFFFNYFFWGLLLNNMTLPFAPPSQTVNIVL